MSFFVVDVEADGPAPGMYSMLSFAAVLVEPTLKHTFYTGDMPVLPSASFVPEAITAIGMTTDEYMTRHMTGQVLDRRWDLELSGFESWLNTVSSGRPIFISDNNGFDWMFINWYFWKFLGRNPFGFSSRRIGDLYCGLQKDAYARWKHHRITKHDHNPLNDALGNAEAILHMRGTLGLRIDLK